ncbi:MAG: glycosyltransferase, partial [Flavobacteriaceae bacterium]|nr:glycosyltransferase [Flavobacteriaceae bacterium]
ISSNAGGLPEVNIQGESGFLSDVGNVDEMSENAIKILQDPEMLLKFKKKAKLIAKRFETKMIVPLYEDIYKNALNGLSVKKNNL